MISNDSDLAYPSPSREVECRSDSSTPPKGYRAGELAGDHTDGVGNHWWYQMQPSQWYAHQLPTTIGPRMVKPQEW